MANYIHVPRPRIRVMMKSTAALPLMGILLVAAASSAAEPQLVFPPSLCIVPAYPGPYELKQPSGYVFQARRSGDEWYNRCETMDGYGIYHNKTTGNWEYYVPSKDMVKGVGIISEEPFHAVVGEVQPAQLGIPADLRPRSTRFSDYQVDEISKSPRMRAFSLGLGV